MRALVVGHGRMGGFHRKALRDLGFDVTTVDPCPGVADYQRTPAKSSFDVACIATPIEHLAESAAEHLFRAQRLLVEKPLARSVAEAKAFAGEARAYTGVAVAVGYVERFNPQIRALERRGAREAVFKRWNARPTPDPILDLRAHDIDLASHLGVEATFDTRSACGVTRREIVSDKGTFDLCDHDTSPLHAQWHAFLTDNWRVATVVDAIAVLRKIAYMAQVTEVAA